MNNILSINVKAALGAFNRPQSNNNPSTFSIIPKSALIGIIGAVIGLDRKIMKDSNLYKTFSEGIKYSVKLNKQFKIKSWSEYGYNHYNKCTDGKSVYSPQTSERLVDIDYDIHILYNQKSIEISNFIDNFKKNIIDKKSVFSPYLGMANFLADINFISAEEDIVENSGEFITDGFCTDLIANDKQDYSNINTEDIPTLCKSFLSHDLKSYKTIYFHNLGKTIEAKGSYYNLQSGCYEFI